MKPAAPAEAPLADRHLVDYEVLRLSLEAPARAAVWHLAIAVLMALYFGYPERPWHAVFWMTLVLSSLGLRLFWRQAPPPLEALAIARSLRRHQRRVLFSAFGWGSAGLLLFDAQDAARQMALTVALVSTCIAFSFSATAHGPTVQRALPLLIAPVVLSLILSQHDYMWVLGLIGASFTVLMLRLVTARSRQLEENIMLRIEAQRAREDKQRFFAAASHDLRQPLQALNLYHTLMKRGDTSADVVAQMGACLQALDRLLEGILEVSRLDAGQVQPTLEAVHLPELMLRVFSLHSASARAKGLRPRLHTVDRWVMTDAHLTERILSNLLVNAIRYTDRGGVLLSARVHGGQVRIQVMDTGRGIAAEQLEQVFQEFSQLHNPQRDPDRGTGLGLAIVQRLSRLLQHPLSVRSRPGRGSCFEILVPLAARPAAPVASEGVAVTGKEEASGGGRRVLVVEDNPLVREGLVSLLHSWGMQVQAAADGTQALVQLSSSCHGAFDGVISDWRLPGDVDGVAVLAHARQSHGVNRLILLTGESEPPAVDGITVLRKPIRPLRLRALLGRQP